MARTCFGPAATVPGIFRRYWTYTRGDRCRLLLGGLASVAVCAAEIAVVLIFDNLTDTVLARRQLHAFWWPDGLWLAAAALAMLAGEYPTGLASERVLLRLRDSLFGQAQRLRPGFFDQRRLGDLMIRLTDDVAEIEGLVASGLTSVIASAVGVVALAGAAVWLSPERPWPPSRSRRCSG